MPIITRISKPLRLVERVIDEMQGAIASGEYGLGTKLPAEPELVRVLGVSRSTFREAVRALAHNGVLEVRQGDGTYVRSLPSDGEPLNHRLRRAELGEIEEVRRALELEIVRLAAERRNEKDIANMRSFLSIRDQAIALNDTGAALDADIAFHCAVAWAAHNEVFADLYRIFVKTLRKALAALWERAGSESPVAGQLHIRLVEAIAGRDVTAAVAAALALLDRHESVVSGAT